MAARAPPGAAAAAAAASSGGRARGERGGRRRRRQRAQNRHLSLSLARSGEEEEKEEDESGEIRSDGNGATFGPINGQRREEKIGGSRCSFFCCRPWALTPSGKIRGLRNFIFPKKTENKKKNFESTNFVFSTFRP